MQISQKITSLTQPNLDWIWWRKISQPIFYQKRLTLCIKILLSMKELNSFVTIETYQVSVLFNNKSWSPLSFHFHNLLIVPLMHDPASVSVSSSLWPGYMIFKLKIINILKSSGWGLKKCELPWQQIVLWR